MCVYAGHIHKVQTTLFKEVQNNFPDDLEEVKGSVLPYDYMTVARRKGAMQLSDWVEEHAVVGVHGFWRRCKATLRFGAPFHSPCVI